MLWSIVLLREPPLMLSANPQGGFRITSYAEAQECYRHKDLRQALYDAGEVIMSDHAFDKARRRGIIGSDIIDSVAHGIVVEDYPDYYAGPAVLVLQSDRNEGPLHAVWGLKKGTTTPAVVITAYRPDPAEWDATFRKRKP